MIKTVLLLLASASTVLALTACGGGDADSPEKAMQSYLDALAGGDAEAACELLGPSAADTSLAQPDCEASEPTVSPEAQEFGESEVGTVEEDGSEATVDVTADDSATPITVDLVQDDDEWRVNGLAIAEVGI